MNTLDYLQILNIVFSDIDMSDYPDFSDAYIISAEYGNRELTDSELDLLNQDRDFVHTKVFESLF